MRIAIVMSKEPKAQRNRNVWNTHKTNGLKYYDFTHSLQHLEI